MRADCLETVAEALGGFYNLSTIRTEGHSVQGGDVRHFGTSKECTVARQFLLGVV